MSRRYEWFAYVLTFTALIGFFVGWKLLTGQESPEFKSRQEEAIATTAANVSDFSQSENADDPLRIYGVYVIHTPPFKDPFIGYGVYLGQGLVLTAAHLVGRLPAYSRPRIIIAGEELPAKVLKQGSPEQTDLALLAIDQTRLPISLQLRHEPLCQFPLQVGMQVIVLYPERTARSQIISPLLIAPQFRSRFATLINEDQGSGSGVFSADKKCLIGIMSGKVTKYAYQGREASATMRENGFAGYFVPVSRGSTFLQLQR